MKTLIKRPICYSLRLFDLLLKLIHQSSTPQIPQKLLLCNGAHLGDVILTTSLLPLLKKSYPEVKIGMVVGSWSSCIAKIHPDIDWVHEVDHWKLNRSSLSFSKKIFRYFFTKKNALSEIRNIGYDTAIDCYFHNPNMAHLLWKVKIPTRIGFASCFFAPLHTHTRPWSPSDNIPAPHSITSLLTFLPGMIEELPSYSSQTTKREKSIVIHVGTANQRRLWPTVKWKALVKRLIEDGDKLILVGKGPREKKIVEEIVHDYPEVQNLVDKLSWEEFQALISKSQLLIGIESTAGHVAASVGTPAVLLYTGSNPNRIWSPLSNVPQRILTHSTPCSPCFSSCPTMPCIRNISVDEVHQAIRELKQEIMKTPK